MKSIITSTTTPADSSSVSITGIKADNLTQLRTLGLQIPEWMVIPSTIFSEYVPESILEHSAADVISFIRNIRLDSSLLDSIHNWVHAGGLDNELFAVRSSICVDKSLDHTFAGQLKTNLCVPLIEIPEAIIDIWASPFFPKAAAYRTQWGILQKSIRIAVILQKMVSAESSGVAMCFDPSNGSRSNIIITSCYGINTNNAAARTEYDQFTVNFSGKKPSRISKIYEKKQRVIPNPLTLSGTSLAPVPYSMRSKSSLSAQQVMALATITRAESIRSGKPQILDWALSKGSFYILQARAVPSLENIPDTTEKIKEWQTPESTLLTSEPIPPLTYSIIRKFNREAYRSFCNQSGSKRHSDTLKNDFDFLSYIDGHLYSDKSLHEQILQSLPFGALKSVKSKKSSFINTIISHIKLLSDYFDTDKNCRKLLKSINDKSSLEEKSFLDCTFSDLLNVYQNLGEQLCTLWKSLVINEHYLGAINSLYFDKVNNSTDIFSIFFKPESQSDKTSIPDEISALIAVTDKICTYQPLKLLFEKHSSIEIRKYLGLDAAIPHSAMDISRIIIRKMILDLLNNYSTSIKEITEHTSTSRKLNDLIDILRLYVMHHITIESFPNCGRNKELTPVNEIQDSIKTLHQRCLQSVVKNIYTQRRLLTRVKNIHLSRAKKLFLLLGKKFYSEGILEEVDDFQFLTCDEIEDYLKGNSVTSNLKQLVSLRKQELLNRVRSTVSDPFFTHGLIYHSPSQLRIDRSAKQSIVLFQGIGNRTLSVTGEIKFADTVMHINSIKDAILVVCDSNPRWIPCLPFIKGVIIENGTIFSELSLACYRFNIPAILTQSGYSKNFNNGDCVELDSHTGKISIINRASSGKQAFCK